MVSLRGVLAVAVLAFATTTLTLAGGTPPGTVISNQATVDYTDANGNPLQALSNVVTTTVTQQASVIVDPDRASNADPGDVVYYAHVVTNASNAADTINLTASSSQGWVLAIYHDVGIIGAYEPGIDLPVTDTGVLAVDATFNILVSVSVPAATASGAVDVTTVTGTSVYDNGVSDIATDTTTVTAPTLSVVKSVLPAGPQPPGTVLTYTIVVTNNGNAQANTVVLTDPIPANTTYQAGTITFNAAPRTDAVDPDNAEFSANTVTVNVGTLAATGGSATVSFQVQID